MLWMKKTEYGGVNGHIKYFDHRKRYSVPSGYGHGFANQANNAKFSLGSILGVRTVRLE